MNYFKKMGISLLYFIVIILVSTLLITGLNYFSIFNRTFVSIFEIMIPIISIIFSSYKFGKNSKEKGWIEGLKFGVLVIVIMLILNLILKNNIQFKNFIYYFILIFASVIGSIIGINKNVDTK